MEQLSFDDLEIWKPVLDWEGMYEVSNQGHVRSLRRKVKGVMRGGSILKPGIHRHGYPTVNLWKNNVGTTRTIHSLVMESFVGRRPDGRQVRHLDGDSRNSVLANLTYGTVSENAKDQLTHGTNNRANRTHCPQGHEYTSENTMISRRGNGKTFRQCRICHMDAAHRYEVKARMSA